MSALDVAEQIARRSSRGNANTTYGAVDPTTQGNNGDFYINTVSHTIFGPKAAGVWPAGVLLVGTAGAAGATGATGAAGHSVLYGAADPTGSDGTNGDFWVNTTAHTFFGPKAAGSWPAGTALIGPTGTAGATGAAGSDAAQPIFYETSNFGTTGTGLQDAGNLVIPLSALQVNSVYELIAVLPVSSSAITGLTVAFHYTGTGGAIEAQAVGSLATFSALMMARFSAFDSAQGPFCTLNGNGLVNIRGKFESGSVVGNLSLQIAKPTSGTANVLNHSFLSLRKVTSIYV